MLSKEQVEILTDKYITSLYDDLEREVIADIARRVKKTERFTETAELMAQSLREQGYSTARIQAEVHKYINADTEYQKALAENTRAYKQDVKKLIEQTEEAAAKAGDVFVATAGDMSWNDDMQLWKKHDVDLKKPNGLSQLYASIADQTNQEMKNITRSSGFKGTTLGTTGVLNAYQRTMDLALIKVSTGAFSYQQAVKDCVDQLAKSGLRTIDYASGRSYQLDTAVRMCIRTGANQLSGKIQEMNLAQGDTPLVYVDAHAGSRPEHAVWQGQVYAYNPDGKLRDGSKAGEKYGDFFNETDYGSPTGLMGVNCAHHFYPYWEGDPIPEYHEPDPVEIDGKEYSYYEATQEMRKQERGIRQTKREIEAMKNLGEDTSALERKLSKQMKDYRNFSKSADINPRNYALGVKPNTSNLQKTSAWNQAINPQKTSGGKNELRNKMQGDGIEYRAVSDLKRKLSEAEIIKKVSGGDMTAGSCTSVALAYVANKAGWDVRDFRGGKSCDFFSEIENIIKISKLDGVEGYIEKAHNDYNAIAKLLSKMEIGQEYILATGGHTAVIRRTSEKTAEYLELQKPIEILNGYKELTVDRLVSRFRCKEVHAALGYAGEAYSVAIKAESLYNNSDFKVILGFLNTVEKGQQKGAHGYAK